MAALLGPQDYVDGMVRDFRSNRDLIVAGLNRIDGFSCRKPSGAFYVYPNVTKACRKHGLKDSRQLQQFLLHKAGVAVLGQHCFGTRTKDEDQEYVRLSYVSAAADIKEALHRIETSLKDQTLVDEFLEEQKAKEFAK
jgi:aspartate aminotransferase